MTTIIGASDDHWTKKALLKVKSKKKSSSFDSWCLQNRAKIDLCRVGILSHKEI